MKAQFGKILQEELQKEGRPSLQDFANMIGISYRTLFNIFSGKTEFTLIQAVKASKILNTDLIKRFIEESPGNIGTFMEPEASYSQRPSSQQAFTISFSIQGEIDKVDRFADFLKTIKKEATSLGLCLL